MVKISTVDTLLEHMGEYVKFAIFDNKDAKFLVYYDGRNELDDTWFNMEVVDFKIDNDFVSILVNTRGLI